MKSRPDSSVTDPDSMNGSMVMELTMAFGRMWRSMTTQSEQPSARAART